MEFLRFYKGSYRKSAQFSTRKAYIDLIFNTTLFILLFSLSVVNGKLTLTKQCGELECKAHYYCARIDDSCRPCQGTCDTALSNYDQNLCEKDCQDYLHDLMYMRKSFQNHSEYEDDKIRLLYIDIQGELWTLKVLLMVAIIISTVVMIALFALFMYIKRSRNRLGISNPSWCGGKKNDDMDLPVIYSNAKCDILPRTTTAVESTFNLNSSGNNNASRKSTPDVVSRSGGTLPASILSVDKLPYGEQLKKSQKIRREPSESTLPGCYDNPAQSLTHIYAVTT